MITRISRRLILLLLSLTIFLFITNTTRSLPVAFAAGGQFAISGQTSGHSGTPLHITGIGFTPDGAYNLYATTDPTKCTIGDPGTLGLQVFSPSTLTITGGAFSLNLTWPAAINQPSPYYLCLATTTTLTLAKTLSTNTFTVAPPPTLDVAPNSTTPGQSVTLSGSNWLPVQPLNVSIVVGNSGAPSLIENPNVVPDANGSFLISLTIPTDATPHTYAIRAYAVNDPNLNLVKNDSLTILTLATPTPTPTIQPSPTPTPSPTPSPTAQPTPSPTLIPTPTPETQLGNPDTLNPPPTDAGNPDSNLNPLIFGLAGLGILFILIGAIVFAASTPSNF